jgi:hypothetical protein
VATGWTRTTAAVPMGALLTLTLATEAAAGMKGCSEPVVWCSLVSSVRVHPPRPEVEHGAHFLILYYPPRPK